MVTGAVVETDGNERSSGCIACREPAGQDAGEVVCLAQRGGRIPVAHRPQILVSGGTNSTGF